MKFVPKYGFTVDSLRHSANDLGLSDASVGMFKNGAFDMIDLFYKDSNEKVLEHLRAVTKDKKMSVPDLIRLGITFRLQLTQPYIEHWPQVLLGHLSG